MTEQPSHDSEAEKAVLSAMLVSAQVIDDVTPLISSTSFYEPRHGVIYAAAVALHDQGAPADKVTVRAHLAATGQTAAAGGDVYLLTELDGAPNTASATYYAKIVAGHAMRRTLIEEAARLRHQALTFEDPEKALSEAQNRLARLEDRTTASDDMVPWSQIISEVIDETEAIQQGRKPHGISTGLTDLDRLLGGGFLPEQLIVIAARPGMGKSVGLSNIAWQIAANAGLPSLMFSLEMSRIELGIRLTSAAAKVPLQTIKGDRGGPEVDEWSRITNKAGETNDIPLYVSDFANLSVAEIRGRALKMARNYPQIGGIFVDYLQLVEAAGKPENRQVAVSQMSRALKLLAKELHCPVVIAAQLNRGPEARSDKRPQLSDLRESGAVEQDADIVILLHRDDYYDRECTRAGEIDFIVAKNRNGPTDTITFAAQLHYSRFTDMAVT